MGSTADLPVTISSSRSIRSVSVRLLRKSRSSLSMKCSYVLRVSRALHDALRYARQQQKERGSRSAMERKPLGRNGTLTRRSDLPAKQDDDKQNRIDHQQRERDRPRHDVGFCTVG